jgi:hypothetical protein
MATMSKVGDESRIAYEITAIFNYIQHIFVMRNVMKQYDR